MAVGEFPHVHIAVAADDFRQLYPRSTRLVYIHGLPGAVGEYVFTPDGTTHMSGWSRIKRRLDALSGVADWSVHDLRSTIATGLLRLGVRLEDQQP